MTKIKPKVFKKAGKLREGKGFSAGELQKAGLSLGAAVRFRVPVDARRKTAHDENVEALKGFLEERKAVAPKPKKPKGKPKS
jgi:ribosomal protein L13E